MRTDTIIKHKGYAALLENLDMVEAERFITLVKRETGDYTHWRKTLFENSSIEQLSAQAMKLRKKKKNI
jgi:hypothetical protein